VKVPQCIVAISSLFLAHALVFVQTSASSAPLTTNPVFEKNCAKCRGKTATGCHFGGPSLASERVNATSPDDLLNIIPNGKDRMPKYACKLTSEEIDTLVQQIKSLNLK